MQRSSPHGAEPVLGDERHLLHPSHLRDVLQAFPASAGKTHVLPFLVLFGLFSFFLFH